MFDHFDLFAPVYEYGLGPPDPQKYRDPLRLPVDGVLLDAGGGTGRVSSLLNGLVGSVVVGDRSHKMLLQAKAKGCVAPVRTVAEGLPFPDNSFERVLVVDALHHFCDRKQAVADLVRVLKPGGRLLIQEPDVRRFPVKLVALFEKLALMGSQFYSPDAIADMLIGHGLAASIQPCKPFSVWIAGDKMA